MKTRHKGFSAPGYQIFDFKPSIFYSQNDEFWCALCIEPTKSHEMTVVTDYTNYRELSVRFLSKLLFNNTNYALDGCAKHFCRFFLQKKWKGRPARKMMWFLFFFILLVKKNLLRPDAIPLCRVFIQYALFVQRAGMCQAQASIVIMTARLFLVHTYVRLCHNLVLIVSIKQWAILRYLDLL